MPAASISATRSIGNPVRSASSTGGDPGVGGCDSSVAPPAGTIHKNAMDIETPNIKHNPTRFRRLDMAHLPEAYPMIEAYYNLILMCSFAPLTVGYKDYARYSIFRKTIIARFVIGPKNARRWRRFDRLSLIFLISLNL
jgi:hypothetical protein